MSANGNLQAAGGYGPPGGGGYPPGGGGGYGGPPPGGAPPGGGGYGGPPGGPPPGGGGYGGPPGGAPPGGGGYGGPPGGGFGGAPPQGFGPPGGFPGPGGPMMPGAGGDVNTTMPLIINIVAFLFCSGTCIGGILAIVGIIFAVQAGNMLKTGDVEGARAKAKTSMIMGIVTVVLGVLGGIVYGILMAVSN